MHCILTIISRPTNLSHNSVVFHQRQYRFTGGIAYLRTPLAETSVSVVEASTVVSPDRTDTLSIISTFVIQTVVNFCSMSHFHSFVTQWTQRNVNRCLGNICLECTNRKFKKKSAKRIFHK